MEKTQGELLKEQLFYNRESGYSKISDEEYKKALDFCENYKNFLNDAKTERMAINTALVMLQKNGYTLFDKTKKYKAGDKVYFINKGKALITTVFGTKSIENGVKIVASHIDSPRLDLKPNPIYEDSKVALLKTHYYGGIKKYQWTAIPLALIGVLVKEDGTLVDINIGLDENDPVFTVTDLLPHLGSKQMKETLLDGIKGEQLNIILGVQEFKDEKISEKVKLNILALLNAKYDIKEEDFQSAEIQAVPTFLAKDVGLDKSMVGAYGQDDRVCAYTSLMALLDAKTPLYTTVNVWADKEEIGSVGNTGLDSDFLKHYIYDLGDVYGVNGRHILEKSKCLSADVSAGFDPNYPDVYEKNNSAFLGCGASLMKYTGARGKSGTSDASAEFVSHIRSLLNNNNVVWQTCELGKIDAGGGGTVAMFIAKLNIDVIDIGVPVLSMHSPFEIACKLDIYMIYKAIKVFYEN